jgi:hypothetical protein
MNHQTIFIMENEGGNHSQDDPVKYIFEGQRHIPATKLAPGKQVRQLLELAPEHVAHRELHAAPVDTKNYQRNVHGVTECESHQQAVPVKYLFDGQLHTPLLSVAPV